ncbi:MAG: hypothetical protein ACTHK7_19090, partial [Aureliella sp.]
MLAFPGCRIPQFRRPQCGKDVPATFEQTTAVPIPGNTGQSSAQLPWHEFFSDPMLIDLIDQAFVYNQELKILAEDIR